MYTHTRLVDFVTFSLLPFGMYMTYFATERKTFRILKPDEKFTFCLRRNNFLCCRRATIDDWCDSLLFVLFRYESRVDESSFVQWECMICLFSHRLLDDGVQIEILKCVRSTRIRTWTEHWWRNGFLLCNKKLIIRIESEAQQKKQRNYRWRKCGMHATNHRATLPSQFIARSL